MRIPAVVFFLFLELVSCQGSVVLPPDANTNDLAVIHAADSVKWEWQRSYFLSKVDRLERRVNRMELGLLAVSILMGSTLAAACLLTIRDRIRERGLRNDSTPLEAEASERPEEMAASRS